MIPSNSMVKQDFRQFHPGEIFTRTNVFIPVAIILYFYMVFGRSYSKDNIYKRFRDVRCKYLAISSHIIFSHLVSSNNSLTMLL